MFSTTDLRTDGGNDCTGEEECLPKAPWGDAGAGLEYGDAPVVCLHDVRHEVVQVQRVYKWDWVTIKNI